MKKNNSKSKTPSKKRKSGYRMKSKIRLPKGTILEDTALKFVKNSHVIFSDFISYDEYEKLCIQTLDYYNHLVKHRGVLQGTKRFKQTRTYAIKHVYGLSPKPVDCLSLSKTGFPRDLIHLKKWMDPLRDDKMRMVQTILNISRLSKCTVKLHRRNLTSITKGHNKTQEYNEILADFDAFLAEYFSFMKIRKQKPEDLGKTLKLKSIATRGPNSGLLKKDALTCAPFDAIAILSDPETKKHLRSLIIDQYNSPWLWKYIQELAKGSERILESLGISTCDLVHSRIVSLQAPENKQRIVAMVDYWSQISLYPVRDILEVLERKLKNSYMFDQDAGRRKVENWTKSHDPVSLDASDFTDRFALDLQKKVLSHLTNEDFSTAVGKVMVKRPFRIKGDSKPLYYNHGQPMGMQGSFQLANATHALFAMYCSRSAKVPLNQLHEYSVVVGDDIVFRDEITADIYLHKMGVLGIEFSEMKGFKSNDNCSIAEFCKRTFHEGKLISGLSPRPFYNLSKDFKSILTVDRLIKSYYQKTISFLIKVNVKDKYQEQCHDLMALAPLFSKGYIRPSYEVLLNCSQEVRDYFDYLSELKDRDAEYIVNTDVFRTLHRVHMEERINVGVIFDNAEKKAEKHSLNGLDRLRSIEIEAFPDYQHLRRVDNPSQKQPLGRALYDFTMSFSGRFLTFLNHKELLLNEESPTDIKEIITPLGAIIADYNKGSTSPLEKLVNKASDEEKFILMNDHLFMAELRKELSTALYTGDSTVLSFFVTRMDDHANEEVNKKLFQCSNNLRRSLKESELFNFR